jgi:glycosyltransferase involved in cell wall biosynthesis
VKVLYVTTISNTINAFLIPHIQLLLDQGHQVDIACNVVSSIKPQLLESGCRVFNIGFQRSPLKKDNFKAYKELKKLIQKEKYDVVHTHTPNASACVRLASRKMTNMKVIYTAHGFHFYEGAPLKNWLIYYLIERWLARYTDVIITMNKEDYDRAKKSFKAGGIEYIPGVGLDTEKFRAVVIDRDEKRIELDMPIDAVMLLSVGELNENKNHETIIKAIAKLNNPDICYLICGKGGLEKHLKDLAMSLGVSEQVKLLGFRNDISEIYQAADLFVFPSYREGLSVSLMEAMAVGLPCVVSKIRGNVDLIEEGKGGYLVDPEDINGFVKSILKLADNTELRMTLGSHNIVKVKKFDLAAVIVEMQRIYGKEIT